MLSSGEPHHLFWPAAEFGIALGVCKTRIPDKLLVEFLESLTSQQKEFTLAITGAEKKEPLDQKLVNKLYEGMGKFTKKL